MLQVPDKISANKPISQTEVVSAIRSASDKTGVDFAYLLEEAKAESSLNPSAQASTTSARGLFQFIESTWLEIVDRHGGKHGLDAEVAAITRNSDGKPIVNDPQQREAILKLRENPSVSALMAAELAMDNEKVLERKLGREVTNTELYMAHFLGAGGAGKFLQSLESNPDIEAEYIVPKAARNNEAVFYKGGQALSLNQVFARFDSKFDEASPRPIHELPNMSSSAASFVASAAIPAAAKPTLAFEPTTHTQPLSSLPAFMLTASRGMGNVEGATRLNELNDLPTFNRQRQATAFELPLQNHAMTMIALAALETMTIEKLEKSDEQQNWIA